MTGFHPTTEQARLSHRTFGCVRPFWNKALVERARRYKNEGENTSYVPQAGASPFPSSTMCSATSRRQVGPTLEPSGGHVPMNQEYRLAREGIPSLQTGEEVNGVGFRSGSDPHHFGT
ncbi:hypothetical protein GCM10027176_87230 [Actinoallomurus bryophytorum]|uniref:helix-turn-helix domain-containing protein n=1 Tax=Actinoallomurus bryophytorum TaxID=1490222 RepID=UPI00114E1104|nr:helix-turn-helix domain-containing protein [Actinoallomurus bryophytorum]